MVKTSNFEDETRKKREWEELDSVNGDLEQVYHSIGHSIMILDADHTILSANRATEKITGLTLSELRGKKCYEVMHSPDVSSPITSCPMEKMLSTGNVETVEMEIETLNGTFLVSCTPVFDENARLRRIIHITTDTSNIKKVEERLKQSESKYRQLVENLQEGIWGIDENAFTTYVNPRMAEMLGYSPAEMEGAHLFDFMDERGKADAQVKLKQRRQGKSAQHDFEFIRKDNSRMHALIETSPIFDDHQQYAGAVASVMDISKRRRAEDALKAERAKLKAYFENLPLSAFNVEPSGLISDCNIVAVEVLGYRHKSDLVGKSLIETVYHTNSHLKAGVLFEQCRNGQKIKNEILQICSASVEPKYALLHADAIYNNREDPEYIFITHLDITERVNTESALRSSEEEVRRSAYELSLRNRIAEVFLTVADEDMYAQVLSIILETAGSKYGVFGYIDDKGDLVVPTMSRMVWKQCEVPDKTYVFPKDKWGHSSWPQAIREKRTICLNKPSTIIPPGHIPIERHISLPIIHRDRVVGVVQVANKDTDYTPEDIDLLETMVSSIAPVLDARLNQGRQKEIRKRVEADRRALQEQLTQAQKMEAVGRLAGGVAHDFNNMLSIILGYSEMVLEELTKTHPNNEPLTEIHAAALRAKDLTRQLLAFSRKQVLTVKTVDLNTVVTGFEKLLGRVIGEDIDLKLFLSPEPLLVNADTAQLEQVLMNLAVNARDAMENGGVISIETTCVEQTREDAETRPGTVPGPYALLSLSDTGHGMGPDTVKRIFEPFFTTKGKDKGTGLGLATSYGIIKQHGGNIWAYSEPGLGTMFKIFLPLTTDRIEADSRTADKPKPVTGSSTVLIVEDEPTVRNLAGRILTHYGYTILELENIDQLEDVVGKYEGPIDLVLSDVVLPKMNGPEVYAEIRKHKPEARVLYMSGYTEEVITRQGVLNRGVRFLQKPFTVQSLLAKVREALER